MDPCLHPLAFCGQLEEVADDREFCWTRGVFNGAFLELMDNVGKDKSS